MLDYLQKYKNLPENLKKKISSEDIMNSIRDLEKEYGVSLAVIIMRVMVKEISIVDLSKFFVFEHKMDGSSANKLVEDLKEKVFYNVFQYLNIAESQKEKSVESEMIPQEDEKEKEVKEEKKASDDDIKFVSDNEQEEQEKFSAPMQTSNFFFSPEDEDEIKELTKKLEDYPSAKTKVSKNNSAEQIKTIIKKSNLSFSSEEMSQRFRKIVDIYLKKIRNRIDTKLTMMKNVESGGLGISESAAVKILGICDQILSGSEESEASPENQEDNSQKNDNAEKNVENQDSKTENGENIKDENEKTKEQKDFDILKEVGKISGGDADYDFGKLSSTKEGNDDTIKLGDKDDYKNKNQESEDSKTTEENQKNHLIIEADDTSIGEDEIENKEKKETAPEKEMVLDLSKRNKIDFGEKKIKNPDNLESLKDKKVKVESFQKAKDSEVATGNNIKIKRRIQTASSVGDGKIKMEDVKYVPKALGPIEELEEMTLVDFRRLSQDPKEAAKKIEEKIKYLEDDRYARRIQGIRAWRKSPINTLYLNIGQESIIVGRGIENAIKAREKTEKDFLSLEEFNAIMELNKRIRY